MRVRSFAAVLFTALATAGCLTTHGDSQHAIPAVLVQASTDLDCPQKEIRVKRELGGRVAVYGCGHRAVYNTACDLLRCVAAPEGQSVPWHDRPEPKPTPADLRPNP
ncbi:MAG: hypothetical protein QM820_49640 [Minicystis sp.]